MKKLAYLICILFTINCSSGVDDNFDETACGKKSEEYLKTVEAWTADIDNKSKCEAVKKSLESWVKSCAPYLGANRAELEKELKEFKCE